MGWTRLDAIITAVVAAGGVSSYRLLVAGAYRALWDHLWLGDWVPSLAGVLVFLAFLRLGSMVNVWRLGGAAIALYGAVAMLNDNVDLLYMVAAPVAGLVPWMLASPGTSETHRAWAVARALAVGLGIDAAFRIASGGAEPFDHPVTSVVYGGLLVTAGFTTALQSKWDPESTLWSPMPLTAGLFVLLLGLVELGLGYSNALLRLSGLHAYGPGELAALSLALSMLVMLGVLTNSTTARLLMALAGVFVVMGGWWWLVGSVLAALGAGGLAARGRLARGPLLAGLWFVALTVMAVGVYAYPYLGLWPLADRLEAVFAVACFSVALLSRSAGREGEVLGGRHMVGEVALYAGTLLVVLVGAAVLAPLLASPLAPPGEIGGGIVLVSYNLHQGYTWNARFNSWEVPGVLSRLGAQVACLQEVDGGRLTSAYIDQVLLLRLAGYDVAYQPAIESTYGVAVAAVGELRWAEGFLLPSRGEQRAGVKAETRGLVLVNVHLGLDPGERLEQAGFLLERAREDPEAMVLCGDFNEEGGEALKLLGEDYAFLGPDDGVSPTCCLGEETQVVIDYVAPSWKLLERGALQDYRVAGEGASDHLPVVAVLEPGLADVD